jgi:hypothetical protein
LVPLAVIGYLSLNICCFGYWLQIVTTTTTLIDTLWGLGSLGVVVAFELTRLILNMFCTLIFLGHFSYLCSMLKHIIF